MPRDIVEALDFNAIAAAWLADLRARYPAYSALVESDPALKLIEAGGYRELLLRKRINDAAAACSLADATGGDLDALVANLTVERLGGESDDRLRARARLALSGPSTAGSRNGYRYHSLTASALAVDADAVSPAPGDVTVAVLGGGTPDGIPDAATLAAVTAALAPRTVRPMNDNVTVAAATIRPYVVTAALSVDPAHDLDTAKTDAKSAIEAYCRAQHRLNGRVARSGLMAAAHAAAGVLDVDLTAPAADVPHGRLVAPWPTAGTADDYTAGTHPFGGITVTAAVAA